MAEELETAPPTPAAPKIPAVASCRFATDARAARFAKVLEWRIKKGKSTSASDFIWQMFEYIEKNPYSDFPTGN